MCDGLPRMADDEITGPALVLGGNGQDGRFLVRTLLERGQRVIAVGLQPHAVEPHPENYTYVGLDLRERAALATFLRERAPSAIYHFAAVHKSASGAPYEDRFGDMLDVNVASVHLALEQLRMHGGRLIYASSIKAFGEPLPHTIVESTPRRSSCMYAVTKNASTDLVRYYRASHGVEASVVWLANHESALRPADFFIPKLARCLADALHDTGSPPVSFHTLDFMCDWGSAEEYMAIVCDMLELAPGEDFVLGTGRTVGARAVAEQLFSERGLDMERFITERQRPSDDVRAPYTVRIDKLERMLHRRPTRTIEDVVRDLVAAYEREPSARNQQQRPGP